MKKIKYFIFIAVLGFVLVGCSTNKWSWLDNDSTILSAHRGAHTVAPENTVESVIKAGELMYKAVEIDPRVSKDGFIYVMHDDTVDRTTNGTGKIEDMTKDEVDKLRIKTDGYPDLSNHIIKVPTFDSIVNAASKAGLIINIDGSKTDFSNTSFNKKIVKSLKENNMFEKSFFVISDKNQRNSFNRLFPDACLSWLVDNDANINDEIQSASKYRHALLSISDRNATKEHLSSLNKSGLYYQVYGINDSKRLKELQKLNVKMVETDELVP